MISNCVNIVYGKARDELDNLVLSETRDFLSHILLLGI